MHGSPATQGYEKLERQVVVSLPWTHFAHILLTAAAKIVVKCDVVRRRQFLNADREILVTTVNLIQNTFTEISSTNAVNTC